jgi:ABC-type bacteriocin/lantibiotic exporter with double-glycine peptidase domain
MNNQQIVNIIRESAILLKQEYDDAILDQTDLLATNYGIDEWEAFKHDLVEAGNKVRIIYMENSLRLDDFPDLIRELYMPVVAFDTTSDSIVPAIIFADKKGNTKLLRIGDEENELTDFTPECCQTFLKNENGEVVFMGVFSYKSLVSDEAYESGEGKPLTPVKRLFRLLSEERRDIINIFIYAIVIGLISLTLPLGIQATVEFVSGGVVVTSVYLLIALVILGILGTGGLQVMQITIVEFIQRRIFSKAALEFAFRVPRIKLESILYQHAPELVNRFFDVLTLQKGLPKLLIDLTTGAISILFGLLLLSFYHPFFVFFGLILLTTLTLIFYFTGPKGLRTSINESKFKYKVVYWLEELARTINSFKLSGNSNLPLKKTEYNVNNYLKYRKMHFGVLIGQYWYIILFKAAVTGGLLIIGTILVIQREITLGQFVASEVVIVLILASVEKLILYMEVVYDMLTAVDKISQVTDLPLEKTGGLNMPNQFVDKPFHIKVKDLSFTYPGKKKPAIKNVNMEIKSGEMVCLCGASEAGKTTLTNTISGLNEGFDGIITINDLSIRDLDLANLRDKIGKNVSQEDIFEGTVIENIMVGKPAVYLEDAMYGIEKVNMSDAINALPQGYSTPILSGGKGYSSSFINRLILARCLAKRPRLLILNDFFNNFSKKDKLDVMNMLVDKRNSTWTLLVVSNDPLVMSSCDRVVLMDDGSILAEGPYEKLLKNNFLKEFDF